MVKRLTAKLLVLVVLLTTAVAVTAQPAARFGARLQANLQPKYHPNRILIKTKGIAQASAKLMQLHSTHGARVLHSFPDQKLQVIEIPNTVDIRMQIAAYKQSGTVEYAEADYQVHSIATTPNDPQFVNGVLWALNNTGQNGGTSDADIDAPEGWDIRNTASNVVVAIIDTGIRYTHEDLAANVWNNPGEIAGNGVDDDHDGYVDDIHGINAIAGTGDPNDDNGHGTHVAGIIGAVGNNGRGVVGVAWRVKLMACKFLGSDGAGYLSDAITCIDYARTHGAKIMNNSWGGGGYSQALKDAIDAAGAAGIIFVAAAGNNGGDTDGSPFYPADYTSDNIVSVAATTRYDDLAYFSNYGQRSVDLGAPGDGITSTWNDSDSAYLSLSGTSMATPEVSGVLALLRAQFPSDNHMEQLNRLFASVDPLPALQGKCRTGGRVNLWKALSTTNSLPGNDDFANRQPVYGYSFSIEGINVDATKEEGEPNHGDNPSGKSIWWSWTPPADGLAFYSASGSSFVPVVGVYSGSSLSNLTPVASGTYTGSFTVMGGVPYAIAIDSTNGGSGTTTFSVNLEARPANDNFANHIPITGSVSTVTGSNNWATLESGEPQHLLQAGGNSVWWSWTPVISGPATITTEGSDFDTVLAVYTGDSLDTLVTVASNDDAPGTNTSTVTFFATAGSTYQIAVDGHSGAVGNIVLNTPPPNDHFTNGIALSGTNVSAIGFTILASREVGEASHAGNSDGKSIWWSWTAPALGAATIATLGSTFDTILAVYAGDNLSNLSLVAANDNAAAGDSSSLICFPAVAGTTYHIAVDGAHNSYGMVSLQVLMGSDYMITEVPPAAGFVMSGAYSMNSFGTVAGVSITGAPDYASHASIWSSTGGMRRLMTNDSWSEAEGINDSNQVVGGLTRDGSSWLPFIWQNGVVTELGPLDPSYPMGEATGIDNAGRVVGWFWVAHPSPGTLHAFLWQNGVMKDLGVGLSRSAACALNGPNCIIGSKSTFEATGQWPVIWKDGLQNNLPFLPGGTEGYATDVNSFSKIVGQVSGVDPVTGENFWHACIWKGGAVTDIGGYLGVHDTYATSAANSINNFGQIVGADNDDNVALYWENGTWRNLNDAIPAGLGWDSLFYAAKINDRGQIAGGALRNGKTFAYMLTPIRPLPQATILFPTNNQIFYAPQDISFDCQIFPDTVGLARLDIMNGTSVVCSATNAPFALTWHSPAPGRYTLTARTTSTLGKTTNSPSVTIIVLPLVDATSPALTITAPKGTRLSNNTVQVVGTAVDNVAVSNVFWRLGSDPFQSASSTNYWKTWWADVALDPGTNVFQVYASDYSGNVSPTNTLALFYVVTNRLTVITNGIGTLSTNLGGKWLVVGLNYAVTAKPGLNQFFKNWALGTGGGADTNFSTLTDRPTLSFLMQPNLVLEANFTPNPFLAAKGVYNGLFFATNGIAMRSAGFFTLTLGSTGSYTGTIKIDGGSYSFSGKFDGTGHSTKSVLRNGTSTVLLDLQLDLFGSSKQISGTISADDWSSVLSADLRVFSSANRAINWAGAYTLILPATNGPISAPGGDGFGIVSNGLDGTISLLAPTTLGDGTAALQSVVISKDGRWPLYVSLYGGKGVLMGWLQFTNDGQRRVSGDLTWLRLANPVSAYYPAGFTNSISILGSAFDAVPLGTPVLTNTNLLVSLTDGNLAKPISVQMNLGVNNVAKVTGPNPSKLSLIFDRNRGAFAGSFVTNGVTRSVKGALLQSQQSGSGNFKGANQSGSISVTH